MSDLVVYYCGGRKPVIEMLVSIYSLRKYWDGHIKVALGDTAEPYFHWGPGYDSTIEVVTYSWNPDDTQKIDHWRSRWRAMYMVDSSRVLHAM